MGTATPSPTESATVATPITTPLTATATSTIAAATTQLPPGTSVSTSAMPDTMATLPKEDLSGLPVVENATNLASPTSPRPTSCPPAVEDVKDYAMKRCDHGGNTGWFERWDRLVGQGEKFEWDECSC